MNTDNKRFVLYHGGSCTDGLGAKFAAWTLFGQYANYIPVQYNQPLPQELIDYIEKKDDSEVYILDFSYKRNILDDLYTKVEKLVVLDHHESAQKELKDTPYSTFDMSKSGAVLAWEYFRPNTRVPTLLLHVQDRDIWKWELDRTDEILLGFEPYKNEMVNWANASVLENEENQLDHYYKLGCPVKFFRDSHVEKAVKKAKIVNFPLNLLSGNGSEDIHVYKVAIVNTTEYISEIGHLLNKNLDIDFSITFFITTDMKVILSFRSRKGGVNVSEIARLYGGGGHVNSSGAVVDIDTLSKLLT